LYNEIFTKNLVILLDKLQMTKQELSIKAGVSTSFVSDITTGNANPSIKVMEAIAMALDIPLPVLLDPLTKTDMKTLIEGKISQRHSLPHGYERVAVVLPEYRAFIVRKWEEDAKKKLTSKTARRQRQ
jgi:transcriptional regulator with XRE-family HTH domain